MLQGGTISVLAAMKRPEFFTGIVLSAPGIVANPETATACKVGVIAMVQYFIIQLNPGNLNCHGKLKLL